MLSQDVSAVDPCDLFVIGGGINGTGIAADAVGRGLSVVLCEQGDLGEYTSSASSKLIHGGLRYLEHGAFRMVREALAEREVLLAKVPHLIQPLRFVLPHQPHLRPAWLIRIGLFLYDHLGSRKQLAGSERIRFDANSPLKSEFCTGFSYTDCWVDDARLVIANAQAAYEGGTRILTRTRCIQVVRQANVWLVTVQGADGHCQHYTARALVNAAGPWAVQVLENCVQLKSPHRLRLVRGSHLIVTRLYEGKQAYILQTEDRRVVFVVPYQDHFTLVGTTDCEYSGDPAQVQMSPQEQVYLLDVIRRYFKHPIQTEDICHHFSGVRPLFEDQSQNPSAVTRDYRLALSGGVGEAPVLSVFGGKLTTYRLLAKAVLDRLRPFFPHMKACQTGTVPLPGSEFVPSQAKWMQRYPWLEASLLRRWLSQYGCRIEQLLASVQTPDDLGLKLAPGLYSREVDYLCQQEWAQTAEDILWRRTKLGLVLTADEVAVLRLYLKGRLK